MNILILASGGSEAYSKVGYSFPKNLIEIHNKPLLQLVVENLRPLRGLGARFSIVLLREECQRFHTDEMVKLLDPEARVILSSSNTSGAACAALLAAGYIDNNEPLLIANGDQLVHQDIALMVGHFLAMEWDGGLPVFEDVHPRYSYVKLGEDNLVVEAAEKRPISRNASAGRYFYRKGSTFVRCAKNMIMKDAQIEGAFYVCPVYNELILEGLKIGVTKIQRDQYTNFATPAGLQDYLNSKHPNYEKKMS